MFDVEVLIAQLGGIGRLRAMIGAYNFLNIENGLSFKFKLCEKANYCVIKYNEGSDLYNMEFLKIRGNKVESKKLYEGLYAEDLIQTFEMFTGLYLYI